MAQLFAHDRHTVGLYRLLDRKTRDGLAGVMDQIKRKMLNTRMGIEHFLDNDCNFDARSRKCFL